MIGPRLPALTSTSRQSRICSSRTRRAPSPRPAMRLFARRVSGAPPRLSVCVQSARCAARGKPRPARSAARRSSERCVPRGPGVEAGHARRAGRQIQHIGARSAPGPSSAPPHGRSRAWHQCRVRAAGVGHQALQWAPVRHGHVRKGHAAHTHARDAAHRVRSAAPGAARAVPGLLCLTSAGPFGVAHRQARGGGGVVSACGRWSCGPVLAAAGQGTLRTGALAWT